MNYYERALELKDETIANRRHIHKNAETGLDLPKTKAYVMEKLTEYGLEPKDCGYGVTATLGKGGKVLLLRADMDALPMPEESGEEFACMCFFSCRTCKDAERKRRYTGRNYQIHVPAGRRDF